MKIRTLFLISFLIGISFSCSKNENVVEQLPKPTITSVKIDGVVYENENTDVDKLNYVITLPEDSEVDIREAALEIQFEHGELVDFTNDPNKKMNLSSPVNIKLRSVGDDVYSWIYNWRVVVTRERNFEERIIVIADKQYTALMETERINKDISYTYLVIEKDFPARIHVLEVDINETNDFAFEAVQGGGYVTTRESPLKVAQERSDIIALVNCDFFNMDGNLAYQFSPFGATIINGRIFTSLDNNALTFDAVLGFDENNTPSITKVAPSVVGTVGKKGGTAWPLTDINRARGAGKLVVYTPDLGLESVKTNEWGSEVVAQLSNNKKWEDIRELDEIEVTVISQPTGSGQTADSKIPENGVVLSGHGTHTDGHSNLDVIQSFRQGDQLVISAELRERDTNNKITAHNLLGGHAVILKDETKLKASPADDISNQRHPRTGIGYTKDKKKVIMIVVEGRIGDIEGVTTSELSDVFLFFDASDAMNFDGGGSSNMIINGLRVNDGDDYIRPVSTMFAIVRK